VEEAAEVGYAPPSACLSSLNHVEVRLQHGARDQSVSRSLVVYSPDIQATNFGSERECPVCAIRFSRVDAVLLPQNYNSTRGGSFGPEVMRRTAGFN
jgi:hypothetical protein